MTLVCLAAIGAAATVAGVGLDASASAARAAETGCRPATTILESPRVGSKEVQAKAINDRGDIAGFADGSDRTFHAILWKGGKAADAVDLGVLPGYVSSEAYAVNNRRVVFGVLYDRQERMFPFRWQDGRMTLLRAPNGTVQPAEPSQRNAINDRGEIVATLTTRGQRRAVRWAPNGKATFLPGLPGHAWTDAFSINAHGVVSGWSRRLPNRDDEENPVLWTSAGKVVPLRTVPGRSDGIAEATNRAGLTIGYLGNQTEAEPESDQGAVWRSRTAEPVLLGAARANLITELVDVNDRGQVVGMTGTFNPRTGFIVGKPVIWRAGWRAVRPLPVPAASRANRVVVTNLNDVNNHGAIVGNVYGLTAPAYDKLRRIDPVLWTCHFGR
jgi:probable HAF family extracellular repeat protein